MPEAAQLEFQEVLGGPAAPAPAAPAEAAPSAEPIPADQAPADDGAQKPPEVKTDEHPEKQGMRRFERRLDKAYKKLGEEKARADFLERQNRDLQESLKPKDTALSGAPLRFEDFNFDAEAFAKAVSVRERENVTRELNEKTAKERQATFNQQLTQGWSERAAKGNEKYEDFDEIVGDIKPTSPWSVAIMQAENADDIAYFLGTHLKEAQRIASLDPVSQIREIGRLEAKLAADPPKPKGISKAPAPITPVTGVSVSASNEPSENDDMKTWIEKRNKKVHGKR